MSKKPTTILAVIILLAMILTGTFAWVQYNQHKTNEASGDGIKYDVSLIEDFEEIKDWKVNQAAVKKEIRVMNTGLTDGSYGDVYVRLQLKEYMETAPLKYEYTPYRLMIGTDGEFIKYATEAEAQAAYGDHVIVPLQGLEDDKTYYYVQTKAGDDNGQYGKYLLMDITLGEAKSLIDGVERATDVDALHHLATNGECDYTEHVWKATPGEAEDCELVFHDYIKWFLGDDVITIDEWDGNPVKKWICDTGSPEGWVYWGMPLVAGETTSNLLDAVKLIKQPDESFYYALHTDMEAVSYDEIAGSTDRKWGDAPAKIVTALLAASTPTVESVRIADGDIGLARRAMYDFSVEVVGSGSNYDSLIWTIEGDYGIGTFSTLAEGSSSTPYGSTISETGHLSIAPGETADDLTVTATSRISSAKFDNVTVTVSGPLVEEVVVSGSDVALQGRTAQYSAVVNGSDENTPDQGVTWIVSGQKPGSTTDIDEYGMLSVDSEETKGIILTVTAVSSYDGTKEGSVTVTVVGATVGDVTVCPVAVTIAKGATREFRVLVTGENNPDTAVTWAFEGTKSSNETEFEGNVLTIGSDETAETFKVRATSVADTSKYAEAEVTVSSLPAWALEMGLTGTTSDIGEEFTVDGYTWKILTIDGNGNYLIHMTTRDGTSAFRSSGNMYSGSTLETKMKTYNDTTKLPILYEYMQPVTLVTETTYSTKTTSALSYVDLTNGAKTAFALSVSEVNSYYVDGAAGTDYKADSAGYWWLRSPGSYGCGACVDTAGIFGGYNSATYAYGVRPAIWINWGS